MVKTQIFIVCDKCEKPFKDTDVVYGYAKYHDHSLTISESKNYTDYYFDEECLENIKINILNQLKKSLTAGVANSCDRVDIYIPYIGETYKFYKLDFDEVNVTYFYVEVNNCRQLVKIRYEGFEYHYSCIRNAVDLMFKDMKHGRLMDLRREFKEEGDRKKLASMTARSSCNSTSAIDHCNEIITVLG